MTNVSAKVQLARELVDAQLRLERKDRGLEIYAYQGAKDDAPNLTYPSEAAADNTRKLGEKIAYLALRFGELFPDRLEIISGLTDAGSWICARAKQETTMSQDKSGYGASWATTLDPSRLAMNAAVQAVFADIERQALVFP